MSIITRMRKQVCMYWGAPTPDGFGNNTFDDAVEVDCRWDDTQQKFVAPSKEELVSRSVVYPELVFEVGGYAWLGTRGELEAAGYSVSSNPITEVAGAREVRGFDKIPNLRNTETLHIAYLI